MLKKKKLQSKNDIRKWNSRKPEPTITLESFSVWHLLNGKHIEAWPFSHNYIDFDILWPYISIWLSEWPI